MRKSSPTPFTRALPALAKVLGVGLEELLGESTAATTKRGSAPELQQHMDRIRQCPSRSNVL